MDCQRVTKPDSCSAANVEAEHVLLDLRTWNAK
jgi:hypothetical protein